MGNDQTVDEDTTVTLDGFGSVDPDIDDSITYQWEQTGDAAVTLSDPTDERPTFEAPSFDDAGGQPLIFELIVTDRQVEQSQEDSTTVTGTNFTKDNPDASGGGCFIATAAYGSPMHFPITLLREFRDRYLPPNPLGEGFVELYYSYAPPLADFIAEQDILRTVVRWSLLPLVTAS